MTLFDWMDRHYLLAMGFTALLAGIGSGIADLGKRRR